MPGHLLADEEVRQRLTERRGSWKLEDPEIRIVEQISAVRPLKRFRNQHRVVVRVEHQGSRGGFFFQHRYDLSQIGTHQRLA
ncbi:hypothetical protein D3C85_1732650 [compost metagenome]